jgi:hypothetical protein
MEKISTTVLCGGKRKGKQKVNMKIRRNDTKRKIVKFNVKTKYRNAEK